ncbi:MAG: SDR family oxidoreductase [Proteobacteria bacterium]|nr:SDR family oxidoreductase [Pseudomonadota bacterium]
MSGAGGGLGRALALRFARGGGRIVALDRDAGAVAAVADELARAGFDALACACDVTDAGACQAAIEATVARFGRIDVLVNNAGITHRSAFAATETAVLRRVVEVNLFGAINLTRPALPALTTARGLIVAVSSVAGFTPLIARTAYSASKHALHGFFESLRTELAPDGIDVMMVCPSPEGGAATHAQVVVGRRLQPDDVADRVFRGAERSRRLLLVGRTARTAWWVSRLAPSLYERIMARKLQGEMTP